MTTASASHALPRRSAAEQARLDARMVELWEQRITFNQMLGIKVLSLRPGDVRLRLDMRPALVGHYAYGRLHGGAISATLDTMAGMALLVELAEKHADEGADQILHRFNRMGTIDLRVDYLRPSRRGVALIADVACTRTTRQVAFARGEVRHEDAPGEAPLAQAQGTFMIYDRPPGWPTWTP